MLPQNPQALFTEITVREELLEALSDEKLPEDEQAARVAEISREMELDSLLETHPYDLSGGEQQRLALGKILLRQPAILLLDEATSSIDTRTELQAQAAFDELMAGRTSFVVAHRLSTIRNADCILVMRDGQIIERGTHDELLAAGGFYAELYRSQFAQ